MNKLLIAAAIALSVATPAMAFDSWGGNREWDRQSERGERMLNDTQSQLRSMQERAFDDMNRQHERFIERNRMRNGY